MGVGLVFGALCLFGAVLPHDDDSDSQLYTVVARNMAADGTWFDLRYTANVHPQYREHLPFGLWPAAAVIRWFGVGAVRWTSALWGLLTVALVARLGWTLTRSLTVSVAGVVFLATTEQFVRVVARHRLDGPLVFLSVLALLPLLEHERPTTRGWLTSALAVLGATLVKGPFGLVLLAAASISRAIVDRRWAWLWFGATAGLVGSTAFVAFLLHAKATGSDWWTGYAEHQLLASAIGSRTDGDPHRLTPLLSLANRFWPWLPLLAIAAFRAVKHPSREQRLSWLTALLTIGVLLLPTRRLWHHVLPLFPILALLLALGIGPIVERWSLRARQMVVVIAALVTPLLMAALPPRRSVSCTAFKEQLTQARGRVVVAASSTSSHWKEISTLALETDLEPWLVSSEAELMGVTADWALVATDFQGTFPGWVEVDVADRWRLLRKPLALDPSGPSSL